MSKTLKSVRLAILQGAGLALIFSLLSCASSTKIEVLNSKGEADESVKIYVESQYLGTGNILYNDSSPRNAFMGVKAVQLRKAGCQTRREELKVQMNIPKFIGSLVLAMAGGGLSGYWSVKPVVDSPILNLTISGAVFIAALLPSLWANDYKPLHSYDFHCVKT